MKNDQSDRSDIDQSGEEAANELPSSDKGGRSSLGRLISGTAGILMAAAFYAAIVFIPWDPLERYFLGHPVAIAATVLFWIAAAILLGKWLDIATEWDRLKTVRDEDLAPPDSDRSPATRWMNEHDAGYVARQWMRALAELPAATRSAAVVRRLDELLVRQSQRGTTKHLADDLRELSGRDADVAHDSLGLVRIIIWAIPMLGFLGTVIGITQTLGGLDFTDGTAAVDRLKSGLYVAFDTTALGLVLSVVAIFLQFPVERSEQRLLGEIDARVGHLLSNHLPSDDVADNQTALVADLCEGIQAAVAQSLASQTELWRQTIDEAQTTWRAIQDSTANKIADAFDQTMKPALHDHSVALDRSARTSCDRLERQFAQWQETISYDADALSKHHEILAEQCKQMAGSHRQTEAILAWQQALDANLARLQETNVAIDRSIAATAGDGMTEAMKILAQAVEILSTRLPESSVQRRAA